MTSSGHTIMMVDDDPSLLMAVGDRLKLEGYKVILSGGGEQALNMLKSATPDLIILDIGMAGVSGLAFLRRISSEDGRPRYPVLVFTARSAMQTFFSQMDVDGFLAKPVEPEVLLAEVERILAKRKPAAPVQEEPPPGAPRVLLGEDEQEPRLRLSHFFGSAGYAVTLAASGGEIIEKAAALHPSVVVVKQILPGMNGSVVATRLYENPNTARIPVVLYDNSVMHDNLPRYYPHVARYVPSNAPADLVKAVAAVLGRPYRGLHPIQSTGTSV